MEAGDCEAVEPCGRGAKEPWSHVARGLWSQGAVEPWSCVVLESEEYNTKDSVGGTGRLPCSSARSKWLLVRSAGWVGRRQVVVVVVVVCAWPWLRHLTVTPDTSTRFLPYGQK